MGKYADEVKRSMEHYGEHPKVLFLGQAVEYPGNVIYKTLLNVPAEKKIEMPVFEETQMGLSIGLALSGYVPVSIFPRWNFLILAASQLVNHLDKIKNMSRGGYNPKVIIKTLVGSDRPLDPGFQHKSDFTEAFKLLLEEVKVVELHEPDQIFQAHVDALEREGSTLIVEYGNHFADK